MDKLDKAIRKEMSTVDRDTLTYYINKIGMPKIVGDVLLLKWIDGLSNVEIAFKVGYSSAETVSRKITYGVNKFKRAIKHNKIDFPSCYEDLLD